MFWTPLDVLLFSMHVLVHLMNITHHKIFENRGGLGGCWGGGEGGGGGGG